MAEEKHKYEIELMHTTVHITVQPTSAHNSSSQGRERILFLVRAGQEPMPNRKSYSHEFSLLDCAVPAAACAPSDHKREIGELQIRRESVAAALQPERLQLRRLASVVTTLHLWASPTMACRLITHDLLAIDMTLRGPAGEDSEHAIFYMQHTQHSPFALNLIWSGVGPLKLEFANENKAFLRAGNDDNLRPMMWDRSTHKLITDDRAASRSGFPFWAALAKLNTMEYTGQVLCTAQKPLECPSEWYQAVLACLPMSRSLINMIWSFVRCPNSQFALLSTCNSLTGRLSWLPSKDSKRTDEQEGERYALYEVNNDVVLGPVKRFWAPKHANRTVQPLFFCSPDTNWLAIMAEPRDQTQLTGLHSVPLTLYNRHTEQTLEHHITRWMPFNGADKLLWFSASESEQLCSVAHHKSLTTRKTGKLHPSQVASVVSSINLRTNTLTEHERQWPMVMDLPIHTGAMIESKQLCESALHRFSGAISPPMISADGRLVLHALNQARNSRALLWCLADLAERRVWCVVHGPEADLKPLLSVGAERLVSDAKDEGHARGRVNWCMFVDAKFITV